MASLELGAAHDVVPADAFDAIASAIRHELVGLEAELQQTQVEIRELDRSVDESAMFELSDYVAVERRVRAFLDEWLRGEDDGFRVAVDDAKAQADSRIRLAAVEARTMLATARDDGDDPGVAVEPARRLALAAPNALSQPVVETPPVVDPPNQGAWDSVLVELLAALEGTDEEPAAAEGPLASHDQQDERATRSALAAVELSDAEFQRVVGHDPDGPEGVVDAEPAVVYERFWRDGDAAAVATQHRWGWVPFDALIPMVALVVVAALLLLWIG